MTTTLTLTPDQSLDQKNAQELELLLQAVHGDQYAWTRFIQQFNPMVRSWAYRYNTTLQDDGTETLIDLSWAKFAKVMTPAFFKSFNGFASIMGYLKRIVKTTGLDLISGQQSYTRFGVMISVEEVQEYLPDENSLIQVEEDDAYHSTLRSIQAVVKNDQERAVLAYLLIQGERAGAVYEMCSHLFETVKEVYKARRNLCTRIRKDTALCAVLGVSLKPRPYHKKKQPSQMSLKAAA